MGGFNLENYKNIYFIGIGGISMSGLANILMHNGFKVWGSDRDRSEQTQNLEKNGIKVLYGHSFDNITEDIDIVVHTAAISRDNPELIRARELNIPIITRATLLGAIMDNYDESIAVSGTHGKTTTTSMISQILLKYTDPTVTIGGVLPSINSNVYVGNSDIFVAEACEYTNSFHSFFPKYNIMLNIEEDHPDFFKDLQAVRDSFSIFAKNTKPGGTIFIHSSIENPEEIVSVPDVSVFTFGLNKGDLTASCIESKNGKSLFVPVLHGKPLDPIELNVPGPVNIENALAAIALCLELNVPYSIIQEGLLAFRGTHRRFEYNGSLNNAQIYNDYAHHPTEIAACIMAAREYFPKRLWVLFQPHTYSRTKALFDDFVNSLAMADKVILADIYAARESDNQGVSSEELVKALENKGVCAKYIDSNEKIVQFFKDNLVNDDMLIIMGAGNIYLLANELVEN